MYLDDIWGITGNVGYFVTKHFHYYGIINSGDQKIVIGPPRQTPDSDPELREPAFRADVPAEDVEEFVGGMKRIVRMPLESIMQTLCTINYVLSSEKLELEDIAIYESEQNDLKELLERQRSEQAFSNRQDLRVHEHNTYTLEQQMLRMVQKGDTLALRERIASAPAIRGGTSHGASRFSQMQ